MLRLKSILTFTFLLGLSVFIFACGGDDSSGSTGTSDTSSSGSEATSQGRSSTGVSESTLSSKMIDKRQAFALVILSDGRLLSIGGRGATTSFGFNPQYNATTEI